MKVKQLVKKLLAGNQEAYVVTEGYDHNYNNLYTADFGTAIEDEFEYLSQDHDGELEDGQKRIEVFVVT